MSTASASGSLPPLLSATALDDADADTESAPWQAGLRAQGSQASMTEYLVRGAIGGALAATLATANGTVFISNVIAAGWTGTQKKIRGRSTKFLLLRTVRDATLSPFQKSQQILDLLRNEQIQSHTTATPLEQQIESLETLHEEAQKPIGESASQRAKQSTRRGRWPENEPAGPGEATRASVTDSARDGMQKGAGTALGGDATKPADQPEKPRANVAEAGGHAGRAPADEPAVPLGSAQVVRATALPGSNPPASMAIEQGTAGALPSFDAATAGAQRRPSWWLHLDNADHRHFEARQAPIMDERASFGALLLRHDEPALGSRAGARSGAASRASDPAPGDPWSTPRLSVVTTPVVDPALRRQPLDRGRKPACDGEKPRGRFKSNRVSPWLWAGGTILVSVMTWSAWKTQRANPHIDVERNASADESAPATTRAIGAGSSLTEATALRNRLWSERLDASMAALRQFDRSALPVTFGPIDESELMRLQQEVDRFKSELLKQPPLSPSDRQAPSLHFDPAHGAAPDEGPLRHWFEFANARASEDTQRLATDFFGAGRLAESIWPFQRSLAADLRRPMPVARLDFSKERVGSEGDLWRHYLGQLPRLMAWPAGSDQGTAYGDRMERWLAGRTPSASVEAASNSAQTDLARVETPDITSAQQIRLVLAMLAARATKDLDSMRADRDSATALDALDGRAPREPAPAPEAQAERTPTRDGMQREIIAFELEFASITARLEQIAPGDRLPDALQSSPNVAASDASQGALLKSRLRQTDASLEAVENAFTELGASLSASAQLARGNDRASLSRVARATEDRLAKTRSLRAALRVRSNELARPPGGDASRPTRER